MRRGLTVIRWTGEIRLSWGNQTPVAEQGILRPSFPESPAYRAATEGQLR